MTSFSEKPDAISAVQPELVPPVPVSSLPEAVPPPLPDPVWSGWDLLKLVAVTIVALAISMIGVLFAAKRWVYPHSDIPDLARNAQVVVLGQAVGYFLVFVYMYLLVTRERRRPDFLAAIHWNWPANPGAYLLLGFALSVALQALAHLLPIPKDLPITQMEIEVFALLLDDLAGLAANDNEVQPE